MKLDIVKGEKKDIYIYIPTGSMAVGLFTG